MALLFKFTIVCAILTAAAEGNNKDTDWEEGVSAVTDSDMEGNVFGVTDYDMEGDELSDGDREIDVSHLRKDYRPQHYANESVSKIGRRRKAMYRPKRMRIHDDEEDWEGDAFAVTDIDWEGDDELSDGDNETDVSPLRKVYLSKHYGNERVAETGRVKNGMYRSKSMRKPDGEEDERATKQEKGECDNKDKNMLNDRKSKGKGGGDEETNTNKNRKRKKKKKPVYSCRTCGEMSFAKPRQPTYRVISGRMIVPKYKYPWIVNLHHPKHWMRCGGALISATYVLTSAECLFNHKKFKDSNVCNKRTGAQPKCFYHPNEIKVGLLRREWKTTWRQVPITKIIPHEKFESEGMKNDIALIKLAVPIPCNKISSPVCLPRTDLQKMGRRLIVGGWGWGTQSSEKETLDRHLREGMMKQIKPEKCKKVKRNLNVTGIICAIGEETKQTSCIVGERGTSIFGAFGYKFYSLGILTYQLKQCAYGSPVIYTKVYPYIKWIERHVKDLPTPKG